MNNIARFEVHHSDLAELAFLRADSIDAAYSDGALAEVAASDYHVLPPLALALVLWGGGLGYPLLIAYGLIVGSISLIMLVTTLGAISAFATLCEPHDGQVTSLRLTCLS